MTLMNMNIKNSRSKAKQRLSLGQNAKLCAGSYRLSEAGNVAIMTGIFLPVLVIGTMTVIDISQQANAQKKMNETAQMACTRVVGSSLIRYPTDEDRQGAGTSVITTSYKDDTNVKNVASTIETGMDTANVNITGERVSALSGTQLTGIAGTELTSKIDCAGIPPYPRIDEIVYAANFGEGLNGENPYKRKYDNGEWGIIDAEKVGWAFASLLDGTPTEKCGIEMQNWSTGRRFIGSGAENQDQSLPPDSTNPYVVELDGNCNTSLEKSFELHPGEYEFSIWYRGRGKTYRGNNPDTDSDDYKSNQIGMYLQPIDSVTWEPESKLAVTDKVLTMNDPDGKYWEQYTYNVEVESYNLYRITLMGEGASDRYGGLFTSFTLTYKGLDEDDGS